MSGIVAIVSLDGRPIPPELPRAQLAAIAHRGEWEPRLWEAPGIALGHVNLPRTPEAERELLPAPDPAGRFWLTWDGRLDNRDELAGQLGFDAAERREKTDADYVLAAYVKWGDDCVHHLLGDWAVVIWDTETRRLFCAKDPLGWRQLYYAEHDGLLAVGSEPQQFFANNWLPKAPNEEYVLRYLAGAMQREGETCYSNVLHVVAGHRTVTSSRPGTQSPFWQPPVGSFLFKRAAEFGEEFSRLFDVSVKARARSNCRITVSLSGGIDSSCVAAALSKASVPYDALTIYAEGSRWMDERSHATRVAEHLGVPIRFLDVSKCWSLSSSLLPPAVFDSPEVPAQGAAVRALCAEARTGGAGILLGGEGADVWFWGTSSAITDSLIRGRLSTALRIAAYEHGSPVRGCVRQAWADLAPTTVQEAFRAARRRRSGTSTGSGPLGGPTPAKSVWRSHKAAQELVNDYRSYSAGSVGWRDRHAWSANQLEFRAPFTDLRVVELALSVPLYFHRANGLPKFAARQMAAKHLPIEVANRRDYGLFDELVRLGLSERESGRTRRAFEALAASALTGGPKAPPVPDSNGWSQASYRFASAGTWLVSMGTGGIEHPSSMTNSRFCGRSEEGGELC